MGAPFTWSASRHDTFASCRRRYYYAYYAALLDPEVRRLKKLSALPLWAGSVVHDTIERFLRTSDHLPGPEQREAIVRGAVNATMLGHWRESEAGDGGFRLFEHEYGVPVEQEDKRLAVTIVMRSLRHFFAGRTLTRALAAGRSRWLALEDLVSFDVAGTEVFLRMDLAWREEDGRVVIVDWKTGRREGRFNEVQVAGYALYAAEKGWVREPEEITTELDYLVVPKAVRRNVTRRQIEHARRFIERSARDMRALLADPVENLAREQDFPRVDRPQVCRRCNFRRLCFPRAAETLPAGSAEEAPAAPLAPRAGA
ncbi:MAG TPA: PD-(D/E)XK nuclease family protein [Vicinamibacteria bacterium]|nr:PD-(D/E)XK nuclease family protein [Vicinamibacteria bacterium]